MKWRGFFSPLCVDMSTKKGVGGGGLHCQFFFDSLGNIIVIKKGETTFTPHELSCVGSFAPMNYQTLPPTPSNYLTLTNKPLSSIFALHSKKQYLYTQNTLNPEIRKKKPSRGGFRRPLPWWISWKS
jgi:hypothetical protein